MGELLVWSSLTVVVIEIVALDSVEFTAVGEVVGAVGDVSTIAPDVLGTE